MNGNWVVLGVALLVWGLLFFYLVRLERRIAGSGEAMNLKIMFALVLLVVGRWRSASPASRSP